jgi:hypothetical protein
MTAVSGLRAERAAADAVWGALFAAAANGGAYSAGLGGAYGRLAAWTSLGGLVGAPVDSSPATTEERARLQSLFDLALADPDMGTFRDGAALVIQAVLQSPHFLYRPEFGGATPINADVVPLDSWEIATKLSYMLWNTMPDDELFAAAEAGELATKEQIAAQAQRMRAAKNYPFIRSLGPVNTDFVFPYERSLGSGNTEESLL